MRNDEFRLSDLFRPSRDYDLISPMKVALITFLVLFFIQLNVILDTSSPGFTSLYSDVMWIGKIWCIIAAFFVAVIRRYGMGYVFKSYMAFWGYRLMEFIPFTLGSRLFKALFLGTLCAFTITCITELVIDCASGHCDEYKKEIKDMCRSFGARIRGYRE